MRLHNLDLFMNYIMFIHTNIPSHYCFIAHILLLLFHLHPEYSVLCICQMHDEQQITKHCIQHLQQAHVVSYYPALRVQSAEVVQFGTVLMLWQEAFTVFSSFSSPPAAAAITSFFPTKPPGRAGSKKSKKYKA